ncbi:MAG: ribonuclease P protein component [bacterium]
MLAKKYLLNKKEVVLLKQKGTLIQRTPFFNVSVLKVPDEDILKFAFIVSKKVFGKAVLRNKVKRMLISAVRANLDRFKKGYYVVFFLKENIINCKYEEISNLVDKKISKISFP